MGFFDFLRTKTKETFHPNGQLKTIATYLSGKKHGTETSYHENGMFRAKCEWINGFQNGEIISYDENGNKIKQSFLKDGKYEGSQKEWWPNGQLKADRIMKNHKIISEKEYDSNGELLIKTKPTKEEVVKQFKIKDDMPASMKTNVAGHKLLKRDMSGLVAYFKEMPYMERIYNEFTHSIRNGYTVEKYLNNTNFKDENEIRDIVRKGFGVIAEFLEDMLKIKENTELRKDFNACKEVIKILQIKNDNKIENYKSQNISADDYFKQSLDYFNLGVANDPLTPEGASEMKKGIKSLDKAIKLDDKNPKYFYNRGTGKKMILDYKSAIPDFTKAIKLKFESPEMAYFNRAMSKLHTQDLEGSKKDNRKAEDLGYDEYQVEQLDEWLDSVEEMGYDEFSKQFD